MTLLWFQSIPSSTKPKWGIHSLSVQMSFGRSHWIHFSPDIPLLVVCDFRCVSMSPQWQCPCQKWLEETDAIFLDSFISINLKKNNNNKKKDRNLRRKEGNFLLKSWFLNVCDYSRTHFQKVFDVQPLLLQKLCLDLWRTQTVCHWLLCWCLKVL